jgi:outer membrane protein OmpA-like peptidoglycan-associated protein
MSHTHVVRGEGSVSLAVLLGLGGLDLTLLNVLVVPAIFAASTGVTKGESLKTQTSRSAAVAAPVVLARSAPEPEQLRPAAPELEAPVHVTVMFELGRWQILPEGRELVLASVRKLKQNQEPIEVVGHADKPGSRSYNQHLSELRAQAVTDLLAENGVDVARIIGRGVGEDEASGNAHDRRVDVLAGGAQ